jgi:phosphatidylglycerophosphate synthase
MLDGVVRKVIDPVVDNWGQRLSAKGWSADTVTLIGLTLGVLAAVLIASGLPGWLALLPLLAGRVADGLDGAIARAGRKTDFGGFLDIVADFLFYGAVPLAFAIRAPEANALAAAFVLFSFYVNGASFLGYAVLAEKKGLRTSARGDKSLYFTSGLLEGTETILFLSAICLWPDAFAALSWGFGALCLVTAISRVLLARRVFGTDHTNGDQT